MIGCCKVIVAGTLDHCLDTLAGIADRVRQVHWVSVINVDTVRLVSSLTKLDDHALIACVWFNYPDTVFTSLEKVSEIILGVIPSDIEATIHFGSTLQSDIK